jgi:steroid 5-alpha reductase family enzyme
MNFKKKGGKSSFSTRQVHMAVFPLNLVSLIIVSLAMCAIGFYRYRYFLSIGRSLATAGCGLTIACLYAGLMTFPAFLLCFIICLYGLLLTAYSIYREMKMKPKEEETIPVGTRIIIWIVFSLMDVFMVLPVFYRVYNGGEFNVFTIIGLIFMISGAFIEVMAVITRHARRKVDADDYIKDGIYKYTRAPRYFGELLFYLGIFISGIGGVFGIGQWLMCLIGLVLALYVILMATKRHEKAMSMRYQNIPGFEEYMKKTPLLIPFVPLYSLSDQKWII